MAALSIKNQGGLLPIDNATNARYDDLAEMLAE